MRLKLKNSRGQPYTLAMHFYPGAVHAAAPIVEAAAKIPGLLGAFGRATCLRRCLKPLMLQGSTFLCAVPARFSLIPA